MNGFIGNPSRNESPIVAIWSLAVHQHAVRHSEFLPTLKRLPEILHREQTPHQN